MSQPRRIGLLGGSFNPAHRGHRAISLFALKALGLDEIWWLVTPGNPLKRGASDMASLPVRLASARKMARRARIRATAIETQLGTQYTADTLEQVRARYPKNDFIWIMGADNLAGFHRWERWRDIAQQMPIAVIARPGYDGIAITAPAMAWFGHRVRPRDQARNWTRWSMPALVLLRFCPDPRSATALRRADPDWHHGLADTLVRDHVTRQVVV
ncbi:nicotinate-nucleotide adenylyltransferase [Blastomonas sp.]|uniref:nicotinate-nucleotide adenylyltransferase n=1 Tax=Blastomonas sp. TaxID=1909299 RepID=UPI003593BD8B